MTSGYENAALVDETKSGADCKASAEAFLIILPKTQTKSTQ